MTTTVATVQPSTPRQIASRFKARMRRADFLEVLMYFSLAIVIALFFADKGVNYFTRQQNRNRPWHRRWSDRQRLVAHHADSCRAHPDH